MVLKSKLSSLLEQCVYDMKHTATSGRTALDAQTRAYDLLSVLMDDVHEDVDMNIRKSYIETYESLIQGRLLKEILEEAYDETALKNEVAARKAPLERACTDARFEAASIAGLHEFAKDTWQTWQTAGIFMRKRALKALRERAGFRLESHRIGNYVAKTFDLMNEAQMRFAKAQQAVFAADVTYKIQPGIYFRIYEELKKEN